MILTQPEVAKYALSIGKVFMHVCDTPGCGKLLGPGDLYVILKWAKRTDGLQHLMGRLPSKVRCMSCEKELHPVLATTKVTGSGRGAKKVAPEVAATLTINPQLRRCVIKFLQASPTGIPVQQLMPKLKKKKFVREMSAKEVRATIKAMKKLKLLRCSKGMFLLPKEKKGKKRAKAA